MDVRLPRLGEGADSGTIASIFVKEGDQVKQDQPILELESEKAVATIPAPAAGTVTKLYVKEGDEIKLGQMILTLSESAGAPAPTPILDATAGDEEPPGTAAPAAIVPPVLTPAPAFPPPVAGAAPAASPSVRKIARELGIDLTRVRGSERGGRITLADVRQHIGRLQTIAFQTQSPPGVTAAPAAPPSESIDFARWGKVTTKKMTTLRRTVSGKMTASWTTIPHITQFDEADISGILSLRKKFAAKYERKDAHLTLTAFALLAVVPVLKKYPVFNSSIDEAAGTIVTKQYVHIGIAVDTEQGLIVPVLRDVDRKSMLEIATELNQLAERTRQRKVTLDEMQGGSFTISNQGGIGSGHFTPIVNKPEVAILGLGRGSVKPVVRGTKIERRTMLPLSLSYDHRIIDGADAARFMVELVQAFENFKEADVRL
jgi:pyruvate dehydrogenase E2 component (dihydrolipoamide acetyltransferase)